MSEAKKDPWARYDRMKLPPERVAELRAESQRRIDKARADGVYEGLMKWKGKVHWEIDIDASREDRDLQDFVSTAGESAMSQPKTAERINESELTSEERWKRYRQMALTPEQVAQGRAEVQKEIDRARAAGVYEGLLKWEGESPRDIDIDALREDRD
jgi:hypothetical protein